MRKHKTITHNTDICIIGGGLAGICAALAAARHGSKVTLIHDRPVLGGNASSECRMHICGADRHNEIKNMRETGILEELRLENLYRNPNKNFSIWDTILYEKLQYQPNITLLLNCSCLDADMNESTIASVTAWQLTTETYHTVNAKIFIDTSGDGILAPLSGANFKMGREARNEFNESLAPQTADDKTMGMTCLFQARQYDSPQPFTPPPWARRLEKCDDLPYGIKHHNWWKMGYWWIELGGESHSIHDTESLRDQLLQIVFGVWDHIKNHCPLKKDAANWALDWIQFLPAKRESRRFIGAHVLTQNDIEAEGRFDDIVAFGGWTMDDHHPAGFNAVTLNSPATNFNPCPSPYGIPYRSLYSNNITNLMFAGRNASCTHSAMSSTRVMGTAASMGQAVGTAAALATQLNITPPDINQHITQLQQSLLRDDAYLPRVTQQFPQLTTSAKLTTSTSAAPTNTNPEPARDGITRPVNDNPHSVSLSPADHITYTLPKPSHINSATLVLDSALDKNIAMSHHQKDDQLTAPPAPLPRTFKIEIQHENHWQTIHNITDNYQRLITLPINKNALALRFTLDKTWGNTTTQIYAFYIS